MTTGNAYDAARRKTQRAAITLEQVRSQTVRAGTIDPNIDRSKANADVARRERWSTTSGPSHRRR